MATRLSYKARFTAMRDDTAIQRAEQYAKWTLPQLMADMSEVAASHGQVAVERDYQEMGALLVNNLAAKLAGLLFPVNHPFFRVSLGHELTQQAVNAGHTASEIQAGLASAEMESTQQLFKNASYNQLVMALKHLIVTGSTLMYRDPKGKRSTSYGMNQFTARRDTQGALLDCVLREYTFFDGLPGQVQEDLRLLHPTKYADPDDATPIRVELYTRIHRVNLKNGRVRYDVSQEADDIPVGKPSTYPAHLCPWQSPTWSLIAGENMGRGLVEDYAGGFAKLSDLSQAATLYEIETAKVLNLVAAGNGANVDAMANAECGEWVTGDPNTVAAYESGSEQKSKSMRESIEVVFGRLAKAFMYTGNTRDAERVTAQEIQQDALEAENTLGGTYSSLAESMQVPLAHLLLTEVRPGILEGLVTEEVQLDIIAGMPALGRSTEVQNVIAVVQEGSLGVQLSQIDPRVDSSKVMDVIYAGRSVDTSLIFKSDKQMKEEAQAAQDQSQGKEQMLKAASLTDLTDASQAIQ